MNIYNLINPGEATTTDKKERHKSHQCSELRQLCRYGCTFHENSAEENRDLYSSSAAIVRHNSISCCSQSQHFVWSVSKEPSPVARSSPAPRFTVLDYRTCTPSQTGGELQCSVAQFLLSARHRTRAQRILCSSVITPINAALRGRNKEGARVALRLLAALKLSATRASACHGAAS